MYPVGIAKPVYMMKAKMNTAAGAIASDSERDNAAIERKNIDIVKTQTKLKRTNVKKWLAVLRRFVIK